MFEQAVQASEAMQLAAQEGHRVLIPAFAGCSDCRTTQMITAPMLGVCQDCGTLLRVLSSTELHGGIVNAATARGMSEQSC